MMVTERIPRYLDTFWYTCPCSSTTVGSKLVWTKKNRNNFIFIDGLNIFKCVFLWLGLFICVHNHIFYKKYWLKHFSKIFFKKYEKIIYYKLYCFYFSAIVILLELNKMRFIALLGTQEVHRSVTWFFSPPSGTPRDSTSCQMRLWCPRGFERCGWPQN